MQKKDHSNQRRITKNRTNIHKNMHAYKCARLFKAENDLEIFIGMKYIILLLCLLICLVYMYIE